MSYPRIPDLTWLDLNFNAEIFYEKRMENDVDGDPIYVGFSKPGSVSSEASWFIIKLTYDAQKSITRQQIANDVPAFIYVYDDRATYF